MVPFSQCSGRRQLKGNAGAALLSDYHHPLVRYQCEIYSYQTVALKKPDIFSKLLIAADYTAPTDRVSPHTVLEVGIKGLPLNQSCYIVLLGLQTVLSETTVKRLLNIGCVSVIPLYNHWNMMYGKFHVQASKETLTVCNFTNTISTSQSFQKDTQWLINHWLSIER